MKIKEIKKYVHPTKEIVVFIPKLFTPYLVKLSMLLGITPNQIAIFNVLFVFLQSFHNDPKKYIYKFFMVIAYLPFCLFLWS